MRTQWIMKQEWHDVLFLHWPVAPEAIRPHLPEELELDLFNGEAWISIVSFRAKRTRLHLLPPIPGVRTFLELNVRTYVKASSRTGVYFFNLDANSLLAVIAARTLLPYRYAEMTLRKKGKRQHFASRLIQRDGFSETFDTTYTVEPVYLKQTVLDSWLTERYCLWTQLTGVLFRLDIVHNPWQLQPVTGKVAYNSMASFLPPEWHERTPIAHYSKVKKVKFYPPVKERQ